MVGVSTSTIAGGSWTTYHKKSGAVSGLGWVIKRWLVSRRAYFLSSIQARQALLTRQLAYRNSILTEDSLGAMYADDFFFRILAS